MTSSSSTCGKFEVELAHRAEVGRRLQADDFVGRRAHVVNRLARSHWHCANQPSRVTGTQRVQRGLHRGAGREAIVDDDHDAIRRIEWRPHRRVLRATATHHFGLRGNRLLDVALIGAGNSREVGQE